MTRSKESDYPLRLILPILPGKSGLAFNILTVAVLYLGVPLESVYPTSLGINVTLQHTLPISYHSTGQTPFQLLIQAITTQFALFHITNMHMKLKPRDIRT